MAADSTDSLTERDVDTFSRVADGMIEAGHWHRVTRDRQGHHDLFSVHKKGAIGAVLSIGRHHGRYIVINHVGGSLRFGRTLSEALAYAGVGNLEKAASDDARQP